MALTKITYDTKVALDPQPGVANINKVSDSDMNEIKSVVNNAIDKLESPKTTRTTSDTDTYSCNYVNSIIESGSNANGSYVKYVDGTMICYGEKSGTTTWSDYWSFCKRSPDSSNDAITISFPVAFVSAPIVNLTGTHTGYIFSVNVFSVDTTTLKVMAFKPSQTSTTNYDFYWKAIGKWK